MKNTINKLIKNVKSKKSIHYAIIIIVGLLISIPFFWVQIRTTDDGWLHLLRLVGLDNAMEKGSFPFLVQPYICNGWGYSMTAFYPTIVAYVPYLLGLISGAFSTGLKLFAALTTVLSGIFMYNFVNEVTKKKGIAFWASIIYMTFPYKLEDIFNRYAIGEFTAFVFMPLVFQGLYNLLHGDGKKHFYIAIGATGLLLSHTISTEYTAIFCVIYILFNFKKILNEEVIKKCLINVIFIVAMSAMFIIPMLEFESQAHYAIFEPSVIKTSGEYAQENTIELWQLLKDKGEKNGVSFVVGVPFIVMLAIGVLVYKSIDKKYKKYYLSSLAMGIIALIMCTDLFPWKYMPDFLCTLQYPWRLIGFFFFFMIPICAINVYYFVKSLKKEWVQNLLYIIIFVILMGFTVSELSTYKAPDTTIDENYEHNAFENPEIHYFSVNRDYMPFNSIANQMGYLYTRDDTTNIMSGSVDITSESKDALHLEIEIENATKGTELELPYLFYPGYTVILEYDGKEVKVDTFESKYGFISIQIPEDIESGKIIVDYTATILDKVAYIISFISIIAFVVYVVYSKKLVNIT